MDERVNHLFLELTGFSGDEVEKFLPKWNNARRILELTDEDVGFATKEWIPKQYDTTSIGLRKALSCIVREAVDLTLANEYKANGLKILYGIMPAMSTFYYAVKLTVPEKVYVSFPDMFLTLFMQGFFHKIAPTLETAEALGLSYGCRHCALNKVRVTARKKQIIPAPDISWIWGFVCDEGPKTDEFIKDLFDPEWKTLITRLPHDQALGTEEDEDDERVAYLAAQMREGFEYVQKVLRVSVSEEKIREAFDLRLGFTRKMGQLRRLMTADPQPLGGIESFMLGMPQSMPFNTGIEPMAEALDLVIAEVEQRILEKRGVLPPGAPSLMFEIMPYCQPWIATLFAENGVGLMPGGPTNKQMESPRFDDIFMAAAESWLKGSVTVNAGYKARQISERLEKYQFDGLLLGFLDFDRWLGSDNRLLARLVEEQTGKPVFYIEGDFWEDRDYSQGGLRTRIESICEIIKMRKAD